MAGRNRCVRCGQSYLDRPAHRRLTGGLGSVVGVAALRYNSLRAKNIPAAGGVLPLSSGPAGGYQAGGSRSTGSRSAPGGSSRAERVVLRRYGGRLAASGTTRLRPDRYSWKAEGEARGHLRTDTLYNAPAARMFRPHKVIWIATNRVTAWSARVAEDG
ncbi:hypothetical protein ACFPN7_28190 [Amycolatopsis halotolerans]|uniref:hypothetical protein n=1 Tax=Amycolatopsis halotolerans TaxID=330083 RepID=UPI00361AA520